MRCDDCGGTRVSRVLLRTCIVCNGKMSTEEERKVERVKAAYADVLDLHHIQGSVADIGSVREELESFYEDLPEGVRVVMHTHDEIVYEMDDSSKMGAVVDHMNKEYLKEMSERDIPLHNTQPRKTPLGEEIRKWMREERALPLLSRTNYAALERAILLHMPREDWPDWVTNSKDIDMSIKPSDIVEEVADILSETAKGKGTTPAGVTSYQIADKMSEKFPALYMNLHHEQGISGRDSMFHTIAKACLLLARDERVTYTFMDSENVEFTVAGGRVSPGYPVVAVYRLL